MTTERHVYRIRNQSAVADLYYAPTGACSCWYDSRCHRWRWYDSAPMPIPRWNRPEPTAYSTWLHAYRSAFQPSYGLGHPATFRRELDHIVWWQRIFYSVRARMEKSP